MAKRRDSFVEARNFSGYLATDGGGPTFGCGDLLAAANLEARSSAVCTVCTVCIPHVIARLGPPHRAVNAEKEELQLSTPRHHQPNELLENMVGCSGIANALSPAV